MNPWIITLYLALILICYVFVTLYCRALIRKDADNAAFQKTFASLCFFLIGLIAILRNGTSPVAKLIFLGLIFGMIGDVLLVFRYRYEKGSRRYFQWFVLGTVAFFIGHLFYIWAAVRYMEISWPATIIYTVIGFALTWTYTKSREVDFGKRVVGGAIYLVFVVFMGACMFGSAVSLPNKSRMLMAIGGLCFALSDNMLVVHNFGPEHSIRRSVILHYLYWTAQLLFALSISI